MWVRLQSDTAPAVQLVEEAVRRIPLEGARPDGFFHSEMLFCNDVSRNSIKICTTAGRTRLRSTTENVSNNIHSIANAETATAIGIA